MNSTVVIEQSPNVVVVNSGGPQGGPGPQGPSVSDGDKGDVVVSGSSAIWTIDPALLTTFMRGVTASANEAAFKATVNLEPGVDVQAYSAVLAATTASFLTAHATKLGHITVTQAVDLDAIETRVNALDAAVILKGSWDASAGTFPGGGTAQAGESWIVSVAGTVDGVAFGVNDRIIAILDNASTTVFAANWFKADYTDQVLSVAGKTGAVTLQVADITDMSANGRSLVSAADYAAMRALLAVLTGTTTNDNAAAGMIGEFISSQVTGGSAVALTTAVPANVTSIALTAGDWDVSGSVAFALGATTSLTALDGSVSITSATHSSFASGAMFAKKFAAFVPGAGSLAHPCGVLRVSLAAPATVYLVATGTFTVSTLGAYGFIRARRVR